MKKNKSKKGKPNNPNFRKSGQSSLEYFATYSWAVALIVIIVALMFSKGIPGIGFTNFKQANLNGFTVLDFKVDNQGNLTVQLGNSLNRPIQLAGTIKINGIQHTITPIGNSQFLLDKGQSGTYLVTGALPQGSVGEEFHISQLAIDYTTLDSTLQHVSYGFANGKREEATVSQPQSPPPTILLFEWNNQTDFDKGQHSGTKWNADSVTFTNVTSTNGEYLSDVRSAGNAINWTNISWTQATPFYNSTSSSKGVASRWSFDEAQCSVKDNSGNGNNGKNQSDCPTNFSQGVYGNAVCFNGINQIINVSSSQSLNVDNVSIEFWLYADSVSNWYSLVEKGYSNQYRVGLTGSNQVRWLVGGVGEMFSQVTVKNKKWTHVLVTYRDNKVTQEDVMRIYINGVLDSEYTGYGTALVTNEPLVMGATKYNNHNFKGCLDEVRIYNTTLNATDSQNDFLAGNTVVKFQARSCDDVNCAGETFSGPDGTINTFYTSPGSVSLTANKYVQFKTVFAVQNATFAPKLYKVTINGRK